ncbi:unnamed protein product [Caenorhabditis brenneri]
MESRGTTLYYPVKKNLVEQMSKIDLVRVSLQSQEADMALKECGKSEISFFNLDCSDIYGLSCIERAELFFLEVARRGSLPEWEIVLSVTLSHRFEVYVWSHGDDLLFTMIIDSLNNIQKYTGDQRNLKIEDNRVPTVVIDMWDFVSFWDDKSTGLISVLQYFGEKFGLPIRNLNISDDGSRKFSNDLRRTLRSCSQITVDNVTVAYASYYRTKNKLAIAEDNYKFIMENIPVTDTFKAHSRISENFKFDGSIRAKSISVKYGHWFNHKHLLGWVDYENLDVEGKKFTAMELRTFMRK